ncbi:MAG TPA: chemotaxis protein CheW [Gallionellaceae bacterium]|nr:chemotaxis protein CheW [Gallionellaceae bacterium]
MEEIVEENGQHSDAVEWLAPVVALERFEPPGGILLAESTPDKLARYGFHVSTLNLLIKPGCASEVVQRPAIWGIPGAAPWLRGLLNLRSTLVPVFDLNRLFASPGDESRRDSNLVLVFDHGDKAVGLLIDDFPKPLLDMSPLGSLPQLPAELQAHVRGGYVQSEEMWLEFDHESFFDELARSAA